MCRRARTGSPTRTLTPTPTLTLTLALTPHPHPHPNSNPKQAGSHWHGRRKGVVEFVDATHSYAVNANKEFLDTCAKNEHAFHTQTGELTKWMDNAFSSKMKVPFYNKRPHEMNK